MKSSSIFIIIIGSILGYLGYKYYYLPKIQASTTQASTIQAINTPASSVSTTTSKAIQSGKSTISQGIASGLISSSKVSSLTNTQLKTTEIGLGSPIKTAIQKNSVSNALITTSGLTTNTVQGKAYGAKLSNASRLVRVMNTQIPSKPISNPISKSTIPSSSIAKSLIPTKSITTSKPNFSNIPNSIPSEKSSVISHSPTTVSHPISSVFKQTITSSISHPITTTKSIIEPKQSISTSQVHISSPQTIALNRIQSVMKNRSMMRF